MPPSCWSSCVYAKWHVFPSFLLCRLATGAVQLSHDCTYVKDSWLAGGNLLQSERETSSRRDNSDHPAAVTCCRRPAWLFWSAEHFYSTSTTAQPSMQENAIVHASRSNLTACIQHWRGARLHLLSRIVQERRARTGVWMGRGALNKLCRTQRVRLYSLISSPNDACCRASSCTLPPWTD